MIWKTVFPKEFFNETWLILGDHKYIHIAEMVNFFCTLNMLIYAN